MRICLWLLLAVSGGLFAEQVCDTADYPLSSPTERFVDHGDGTVTDEVTMLMWMRCSVGQEWSGGTCIGSARGQTWQSAESSTDEVNRGGRFFFNDWRIPSLREMATIAERQCRNPRVNLAVFPNTPAGFYWTRSSRAGQGAGSRYAISFGAEGVDWFSEGQEVYVRLVRHAP